jgi:SAM-dependent methyltransferase
MFYQQDYRDLYMGEEYKGMESYFQGMIRRGIYVKEFLKKHVKGISFKNMNILEVGCSAGGILLPFLESKAKVKGYDYDKRYLDYGNKYNKELNLCYGGLSDLKNEKNKYDLIILNHVLEHLPNIQETLTLVKEALKPDGLFYVSVPGLKNPEYYFSPTKSFLGSLHIAHLYHFSRNSLINAIKGFSPIYVDEEVRGIFKIGDNNLENSQSEYSDTLKYIQWYEHSPIAKIYRSLFKIAERYRGGIIWRWYCFKKNAKKAIGLKD